MADWLGGREREYSIKQDFKCSDHLSIKDATSKKRRPGGRDWLRAGSEVPVETVQTSTGQLAHWTGAQ